MTAPAPDPLARIGQLAATLDALNGTSAEEKSQLMLKLVEEAGEVTGALSIATGRVARAWLGYTGHNPRKGTTHSLSDVFAELADTATAALVAIARLGGDPRAELDAKTAGMVALYATLPASRSH